jgi:hypothetical protein
MRAFSPRIVTPRIVILALAAALGACPASSIHSSSDAGADTVAVVEGECAIASGVDGGGTADAGAVEYLQHIGCTADFEALASAPLDSTLPGARSVKVVLDQADGDALYFQNSVLYQIHYAFASTHLSGNGSITTGSS